MAKLHVIRMTKYFNNLMIGDVASFNPETAAHILKHKGGVELAVVEAGKEKLDLNTMKVVPVVPPTTITSKA